MKRAQAIKKRLELYDQDGKSNKAGEGG